MHRCAGLKPSGGRCERIVSAEQEYCYSHDPGRAAERRRNAARGGKAKANQELAKAKEEIREVIAGVLSGNIERGRGAVAFQGYNTFLKAVATEIRAREVEELAREVEELRDALEARKENRWGYGSS